MCANYFYHYSIYLESSLLDLLLSDPICLFIIYLYYD